MAEQAVPAKMLIVIGLVFLVLVAVNLYWGGEAGRNGNGAAEPIVARIRIADEDGVVEIEPVASATADDLAALMQGRVRLLLRGADNERRATAVEMASLGNDLAGRDKLAQLPPPVLAEVRRALLGQGLADKGLNDPDPVVSRNCREALVGLWRISESAVGDRHLRQGLAAFEAGQMDTALAVFRKVQELGGAAPPDLYRLLAEVHLARSQPDEALAECCRALQADDHQFLALHAMARAYVQKGQHEKANRALDVALAVYREFPEARELRARIEPHLPAAAP